MAGKESLSGEGSGKVYVPEFLSCSLPCDSVSLICSNGTEIYAVGETGEEREITQGEDTYITYEYRTGIFRISPDGDSAEELEQYRLSWEGSNEEGSLTVAGLAADGEGTLWVTEQVNRNLYELPEGFDGTADEKWEYLTGVGSSFEISAGTAMTSRCRDKEGAWEFLREILLPQSRENEFFYPGSFPVNKEDFTAVVNRAMEKEWQLDEDGKKMLDDSGQPIEVSKGGWMIDDMEISIYAMKQEQLDRFLDLYQSIDTVSGSDDTVTGIVEEETELFFQGDKTAEQTVEIIQNRVSLYVNEQM